MPLYDFSCAAGHVAERVATPSTQTVACSSCDGEAVRVPVSRIGFAIAADPKEPKRPRTQVRKGERVQNYLEAAQELEYHADRTDDPAMAAVAQITRPAQYRARARMAEAALVNDKATWAPYDRRPGNA